MSLWFPLYQSRRPNGKNYKKYDTSAESQGPRAVPGVVIMFIASVLCSIIHSILEDSSILSFFFRFSLLMLCICCKVRD